MKISKYIFLLGLFFIACTGDAKKNSQDESKSEPTQNVNEPQASVSEPATPNQKSTSSVMDTVRVSSLSDLVDNAKSNTMLILEPGNYQLEKDMVYYMTNNERRIIDKNKEETRSMGGQMYFSGLTNFHFKGEKGATVISKNPQAVALFMYKCSDVKISNLTVQNGDNGKADLCYISSGNNIVVDNCKFNKGGAYGLYVMDVDNMNVNNCQITNCKVGAIRIYDSRFINFNNTTITDNSTTVPIVTFYDTGSAVAFNGVSIMNNKRNVEKAFTESNRIFNVGMNSVRLDNCVIRDNEGYDLLGLGPNSLTRSEINGVSLQ